MLKKIVHYSLVLMIICALSIFGVSLVYCVTIGKINEKETAKKLAALNVILEKLEVNPTPTIFKYKDKEYEIYFGKDKAGKINGYGIKVEQQGYSSVIQTMVGIDKEYKIIAIEIVFQQETPGLGGECVSTGPKKLSSLWNKEKIEKKRPQFQLQFNQKEEKDLKVKEGIEAISGSTITSAAVTNSVKNAIEVIRAYRNSQK